MSCKDAREELSAWLDGELSPGRRGRVAAHLAECTRCREHANQLKELATLVHGLPAPEPRPDFAEDVMAKILGEAGKISPWEHFVRSFGQMGARLVHSPAFYGVALACLIGRLSLAPAAEAPGGFTNLQSPAMVQALSHKRDSLERMVTRGAELPAPDGPQNDSTKEVPYDVHKENDTLRVAVRRPGDPVLPGDPGAPLRGHHT